MEKKKKKKKNLKLLSIRVKELFAFLKHFLEIPIFE